MKKGIIITISLTMLVAGFFIFMDKKQHNQLIAEESFRQEKIKIAVCPTYHEIAKKLDFQKYQIIPTASTAESLNFLLNKKADIILAGRTLKPNEPRMDYLLIDEGYSFLSNQEFTVYVGQLKNHDIYTDLDPEELKNFFLAQKIEEVNDVYQYLDKGVVITSWENTDYNKAEIVHLLESSGERVKLSRRPTIYCPESCGEKAREIKHLLK